MISLHELLDAPDTETSQRARRALQVLLGLEPSSAEALSTHRTQHAEVLEAVREHENTILRRFFSRTGLWVQIDAATGTAWRRDGVDVSPGNSPLVVGYDADRGAVLDEAPRRPTRPVPWTVSFPPVLGGARPRVEFQAPNLAAALQQVDARWPCPDWWSQFIPETLRRRRRSIRDRTLQPLPPPAEPEACLVCGDTPRLDAICYHPHCPRLPPPDEPAP